MELGPRILSALRWGAGAKFVSQLFTWAMTIVVIRLLSPQDYGLMAMAVLVSQFLMLLNEIGLGAVLVQRTNLNDNLVRQIFGLVLIINGGFFSVLYAAAPLIAAYFGEDRLVEIIRLLAFQFLIAAFEVIPVSILERNLDFKKKSLVYLGASVSGGIVTFSLALTGYGVWALVWGNMTVLILNTVGVNLVSPYLRWPKFDFRGMRGVINFGGMVTLERAMWFLYTQADVLIVGKFLGKELLGIYSVAMHLASLVMHKTGGVIYEVAFPSFSRSQEDLEQVTHYFLKAVRIMSFVTFPLFFGISSIAPELVSFLLGEKWRYAGTILAILSLVMPLRMISNLLPPVLQGIGHPVKSVFNLLIAITIMPAAFMIGTKWSISGVSFAWLTMFPIVFTLTLLNSLATLRVSWLAFLSAIYIPLASSLIMYAVVMATRILIDGSLPLIGQLTILVLAGMLTYGALAFFVHRDGYREVMALVRR